MRVDAHGRLQYSTRSTSWAIALRCWPNTAGYRPALFQGIYVTHMTIMKVADLILGARQTGDYSAAAFAPLEEMTLGYIDMHDRLVANSYKAWGFTSCGRSMPCSGCWVRTWVRQAHRGTADRHRPRRST